VDPGPGQIVAVSAAAGGVGSAVVQLPALHGAHVLARDAFARLEQRRTHGKIVLLPEGPFEGTTS
jgi:NADPH:quinone reductase